MNLSEVRSVDRNEVALYCLLLVAAISLILLTLHLGQPLSPSVTTVEAPASVGLWEKIRLGGLEMLAQPPVRMLFQVLLVVSCAGLCGRWIRHLGQPRVMGEMLAGIFLGKSLLGLAWPEAYNLLFPESSLPQLFVLSQIGLIFYMFTIGLELETQSLRGKVSTAVFVSHVSILIPFLLGTSLSLYIFPAYAPEKVHFVPFALFMGIAMSITAFPVLARIVAEHGLLKTPLGRMAITCAAVDDITAWSVLALVIGVAQANGAWAVLSILALTVGYVFTMLRLVRPWLRHWLERLGDDEASVRARMVTTVVLVLASSLATEFIGVHALFGAFMAGVIMPQSATLRRQVVDRITDLSTILLLPLFFAYTGLRMQVALLDSASDWLICGLIIFVAVLGKLGASSLIARWRGQSWREALSLGALMNTRGLMELIVLNIGFDLGILSPRIFTMMVIMAVVTTMMTGPLLRMLVNDKLRASWGGA